MKREYRLLTVCVCSLMAVFTTMTIPMIALADGSVATVASPAPPVAPVRSGPVALKGLESKEFQHPWDTAALNTLGKAKGIDWLTSKFLEYGPERFQSMNNMASRILLSQDQLPEIHGLLVKAAGTLDMPVPKLFMEFDPYPNALTFGVKEPYIVITSGLVDLMDEEEITFVLGHELGHIRSGHVLYNAMAGNIGAVLTIIGQATLGLGDILGQGLQAILLDWSRKSEFSADRAGLLACQDTDVAVRTMMKLAGGFSSKSFGRLNREAFLKQADDYYRLADSPLNAFYQAAQTMGRTHPWPVLRAAEINRWGGSEPYLEILRTHGSAK